MLFIGPSILAFNPESLMAGGITDLAAANSLNQLAHTGIKIALGLAIFGSTVEVIKSAYKLLTQKID
jgi:hypothetical protein